MKSVQVPLRKEGVTISEAEIQKGGSTIRVLHVDDDPAMLEVSKKILMIEDNFEIDFANCVDEAIKKLSTQHYDAVISDYEMPQKNGIDFLKELREQNNMIPFILFTGKGREEVAIQALNLGANGYINKHSNPETVYGELSHNIKSAVKYLKSEEKYRILVNFLPEMVFELDANANLIFVNDKGYEMMGYLKEEIQGPNNAISFVAPADRERAIANIKDVLSGKKVPSNEYVFIKKDGTHFPVSMHSVPLIHEGKIVGLRGIAVDISERKKYEETLKSSRQYLETLLLSVLSGIMVIDCETRKIIDANPAALKMIGARREEVLGKVCHEFVCPNEVGKCPVMDIGRTVDKAEKVLIKADGRRHPVIKSVAKIELDGKPSLIESFEDISALKEKEKEVEESQKKQAIANEKLGIVGSLTRHDVSNKLMVIQSNTYLLKKEIRNNPKLDKYLIGIEEAVNQSNRIFEFSRLYEKIGAEEPSEINVEESFNQAAKLVPNIPVEIVNKIQGLTVKADSMLRQLFYNLIDNSLKHGEKVSQIRISYTREDQQIKLLYEDNGVGIMKQNKEKIFSGSFTTGGSGLGLKLVKKMIEAYGWTMKEIGAPGKGAKFQIIIPNQTQT